MALREINVDTPVPTRQGRHQRDCLVTLRMEKQRYFSENHTQDQRGSNTGRMHDWRSSQAPFFNFVGLKIDSFTSKV